MDEVRAGESRDDLMEVVLATTWQIILFVRSAERRAEKANLLARSVRDPERDWFRT